MQRRRKAGEPGMPAGAVYVGRPSRFGRPWIIGEEPVDPSLFGTPDIGSPATVYDRGNVEHGHLLIASALGDWLFTWTGGGVVRCNHPGAVSGVDLTAEQLRTLRDYCDLMANRIDSGSDSALNASQNDVRASR